MRDGRSERWWLLTILVVAAAVRALWVVYAARPPKGFSDAAGYLYHAEQIARGRGFRSYVTPIRRAAAAAGHPVPGSPPPATDPPTAFYPPGYPATLAALLWLGRRCTASADVVQIAAWFNVACGVATVLLVAAVARHEAGPRAALIAATLVAVFPNLVYYTAVAHLETFYIVTVMAALWVAVAGGGEIGRPSARRLVVLGALLGASTLVRPVSLLLLPALACAWLASGAGWRRASTNLALVVGVLGAVVTPWIVRNVVRIGAPLISSNVGETLCIGHHPGASGHFDVSPLCLRDYGDLDETQVEVRRNRDDLRLSIEFARDHPAEELRLLVRRAYYAFRNDHDGLVSVESTGEDRFLPSGLRTFLTAAGDGWYLAVLVLALVGLPRFARARRPERVLVLGALAALASVPLVLYGLERFKVPALPLLAIVAATTLDRPARSRQGPEGRHRGDPRPLALANDSRLAEGDARAGPQRSVQGVSFPLTAAMSAA